MEVKRTELDRESYVDYFAEWLTDEEAAHLHAHLIETEAWEHRSIKVFGKEVKQPRLISWAGELPYRYSGQTLEPRPLSPALEEIRKRVSEAAGVDFNHLLLNRYRDGRDHMGMHADDERELGKNPVIAAVSLGAPRRFLISSKNRKIKRRTKIMLEHGSLMVMGGAIQHRWRHGVPKLGKTQTSGDRINLTFRRLVAEPRTRARLTP